MLNIEKCRDSIEKYLKASDNRYMTKLYYILSHMQLSYNYGNMNSVTEDTIEWCKNISSDFDTVVAIPRSGMIPGSIIACSFGKALSTPEMVVKDSRWISGQAKKHNSDINFYKTVLLVDDFAFTGKQMKEAKELIESSLPGIKVICAALYTTKGCKGIIDRYYKIIDGGNLWNWDYNIMHGKPAKVAYDMDGVLCEDWKNQYEYEYFVRHSKPYKIPIYEIDCIITARKEKYRSDTEQWLREHNVRYKTLYMLPDNEDDHVKYKVGVLIKEKPYLYFESDPGMARECSKLTGVYTVCVGNGKLY